VTEEKIEALLQRKEMITPTNGVPAEGEAFWNRPDEMIELITRIEGGGAARPASPPLYPSMRTVASVGADRGQAGGDRQDQPAAGRHQQDVERE